MPNRPESDYVVQEHPQKTSLTATDVDSANGADTGWVQMTVRFLATKDHLGSTHSVFGHSVMPPGSRHETHRHPHAEETIFMLQGQGVYRIGDDWVAMKAGDVALVPPDVPHGFWNTHDTEDVVMVWTYSGANSLDDAGYVHVPDA
ncbi:cupin domain-containing protein [Streptomyces sp. NPDC060205]|uniref:cupin domain-containing protein n=1 Tax=Streptomyces sp. NPDC060205 TaxID=3347072 RepID=UPI00365D46DD